MTTEEGHQIAIWEPPEYKGSDLLPVTQAVGLQPVANVPVAVGRENVDAADLILPTIVLLQGSSDAVKEALTDHHGTPATVGSFMLSTTGEFLKPPLRLLLVQHHRSRVLFPRDPAKFPQFAGLEMCMSRDGETGTVYGECQHCKHRVWKDREPPLCTEQHCFVAMTPHGPAMLRFGRTSFKAAKTFLTQWTTTPGKNVWSHPVNLTVVKDSKDLGGGQKTTFFKMEMRWMLGENTPPDYQAAAYELYQTVQEAWEQGRLDSDQMPTDE